MKVPRIKLLLRKILPLQKYLFVKLTTYATEKACSRKKKIMKKDGDILTSGIVTELKFSITHLSDLTILILLIYA